MEDWSRRSDVSLEGIGKGHVLLEPGLLAGWVGKGSLAGPFWPLSTLSASSHAKASSAPTPSTKAIIPRQLLRAGKSVGQSVG